MDSVMSDMMYEKAVKPTFYFIGVTTSKSSIMKVFPNITLNLPDREVAKRVLNILAFLFKKVPSYEMQFRKDDSFWQKLKDLN